MANTMFQVVIAKTDTSIISKVTVNSAQELYFLLDILKRGYFEKKTRVMFIPKDFYFTSIEPDLMVLTYLMFPENEAKEMLIQKQKDLAAQANSVVDAFNFGNLPGLDGDDEDPEDDGGVRH